MEKTFKIFEDGVHQYDVVVIESAKEVTYQLKASNGADWTDHIKGKILRAIADTGDGVTFCPTKKEDMNAEQDYAAIEENRILLNFRDNYEGNPAKYEVVSTPIFVI